jgi:hypothetical protein
LTTKSPNKPSKAPTKNLELSDELKKLGFSKVVMPVYSSIKNMIIIHNNTLAIPTIDIHNWSNTDKSVKTVLSNIGIDNQTIEKFMLFLCQKYVKLMEETLGSKVANEKEDNGQKSSVDQILIELKYTENLQQQVNYCNSHFFKNFKLNLEMEDT